MSSQVQHESLDKLAKARGGVPKQTTPTVILCRSVVKSFKTRAGVSTAVGPLDLDLREGEIVSLLGPSGCGKSTLLRIIAGLLPATSGEVLVEGNPVTSPQTQMGMAFQSPVLLEWTDVLGNIMIQATSRSMPTGVARQQAAELLELVGLDPSTMSLRPSQLSGGMQQRVAICRAILHDPSILLMDEPFGALDTLTRDQIAVDLERLWQGRKVSVVMVTHSIEEAILMSDRVIVLTPKPALVDLDIHIDLPRPRSFETRKSPKFVAYAIEIREAFTRQGVLKSSTT